MTTLFSPSNTLWGDGTSSVFEESQGRINRAVQVKVMTRCDGRVTPIGLVGTNARGHGHRELGQHGFTWSRR